MNKSVKPVLFWTPRILCILFAIFISLFALDVFGEGYGFFRVLRIGCGFFGVLSIGVGAEICEVKLSVNDVFYLITDLAGSRK